MKKRQTALLCFLTDLGLSLWAYFQLTNYDEYVKRTKPVLNSPDFQIQIYQVLLQSFTFALMLFLGFHGVVYWLYSKEKKWAHKYVRIYSFIAVFGCSFLLFLGAWGALLPLAAYAFVFVKSRQVLPAAEAAE